MTRMKMFLGMFVTCLFGVSFAASAATITYEVTSQVGDDYEVNFTVSNDTLTGPIEEFTIYFPVFDFENIAIADSPIDWDGLAIEPDPFLPDDGFADWLALAAPINVGETLSGFVASFTISSAVPLGDLFFEIVDPFTFDVLEDGFATLQTTMPPSEVPLPGAAIFLLTGLAGMRAMRKSQLR